MNTEQKIIKNKVGLLKLSEMLGSVSEACKVMGYSRDSFYRLTKFRFDIGFSDAKPKHVFAPLLPPPFLRPANGFHAATKSATSH
jgi:hypothetical protein